MACGPRVLPTGLVHLLTVKWGQRRQDEMLLWRGPSKLCVPSCREHCGGRLLCGRWWPLHNMVAERRGGGWEGWPLDGGY